MYLYNLSANVLRLFEEENLTYERASERCDISTRFLSDIVRCKSAPTIRTLEKLCMGLNSTPNGLLLPHDV